MNMIIASFREKINAPSYVLYVLKQAKNNIASKLFEKNIFY